MKYLRGGEELPPVVRGLGPTLIPKPVRFFFSLGNAVTTSRYRNRVSDREAMLELRERVQVSIEKQLLRLVRERLKSQRRGLYAPTVDGSGADVVTNLQETLDHLEAALRSRR